MLRSTSFIALLFGFAATALLAAPSGAQEPAQRLVYTVHHSRYGDIGTYANALQKSGDATTVTTDAHFLVSILGVVLYRQDVSRQEHWSGDRLMSFHGVTTVNGRTLEMTGAAEGDSFVMMTPQGDVVAPASVKLANPWSPAVLRGTTLLTPDRGRMENVTVKKGEAGAVAINGHNMQVKRYEIDRLDGSKRYEVWLDGTGIPVMFSVYNPDGAITFTLKS